MRKILLVALLAMSATVSFGQISGNPIIMKKAFGGYVFYQAGEKLTIRQLVKTMKLHNEAYTQIKKAQPANTWATVLATAGGALIGYPLGEAISGEGANWAMAGVGAGLVVIAIPISQKFNKRARKAVDLYNAGLPNTSFLDRSQLRLGSTTNGVGLLLQF